MWTDPIVDEVHRIREEMLAECGGDVHELFARLKVDEQQHPNRLVNKQTLRQRRGKAVTVGTSALKPSENR